MGLQRTNNRLLRRGQGTVSLTTLKVCYPLFGGQLFVPLKSGVLPTIIHLQFFFLSSKVRCLQSFKADLRNFALTLFFPF